MSYDFEIQNCFKVKKEGFYPCHIEGIPDKTVKIFTDDILVKEGDGTYRIQKGNTHCGIILKEEEVENVFWRVKP